MDSEDAAVEPEKEERGALERAAQVEEEALRFGQLVDDLEPLDLDLVAERLVQRAAQHVLAHFGDAVVERAQQRAPAPLAALEAGDQLELSDRLEVELEVAFEVAVAHRHGCVMAPASCLICASILPAALNNNIKNQKI